MKIYLVGGAVRDKLMGKQPKDFDFSVVLEPDDMYLSGGHEGFNLFGSMQANLSRVHGVTFFDGKAQKPEYFTAKGKFPKGHKYSNLVAEFVLARKESDYADGRRPNTVEVGTLEDDLARRDFTMNAIAESMDGNLIDPYNGSLDISQKRIKAVGDAKEKMMQDALRVMRALRFHIQLGFGMDITVEDTFFDVEVLRKLQTLSDERKMDELNKMFRADSLRTIQRLSYYRDLGRVVFSGKVNLEATMKQKGFN